MGLHKDEGENRPLYLVVVVLLYVTVSTLQNGNDTFNVKTNKIFVWFGNELKIFRRL